MRCKPVTMAELVGGQTYIEMRVNWDGILSLRSFVFCKKPRWGKQVGWFIMIKPRDSSRLPEYLFADFSGMDPMHYSSDHRTFRFTTRNLQILTDLVIRQDLVGYLKLIGVKNPDHASRNYHKRREELGQNAASDNDGEYDFDIYPDVALSMY